MSDLALTLRPIRPEDKSFLYEVYAGTRTEELAVTGWTEEQKAAFLEMQFAAQHSYYQEHFPEALFQIILKDDVPVGRLYVDHRAEEIRLIDIALLPQHRRAGIGSKLMRELLGEATRSGKPVRIHVERHNPALGLYERLGFRRVEDQGVYFLMEWLPQTSHSSSSHRR